MTDAQTAVSILNTADVTCVLCKNGVIHASQKNGIAPMLYFIESKTDLHNFSAADKIVGKAAAMLFTLAGVSVVYGEVMSESAAEYLENHGVEYSYKTLCPFIVNRKGDGICPMEMTVESINDPCEAFEALRKKVSELRAAADR